MDENDFECGYSNKSYLGDLIFYGTVYNVVPDGAFGLHLLPWMIPKVQPLIMKATEQYFLVVFLILLCKLVSFTSWVKN